MLIRVYKYSEGDVVVRFGDELKAARMFASWLDSPGFLQMVVDLKSFYGYDNFTEDQFNGMSICLKEEYK